MRGWPSLIVVAACIGATVTLDACTGDDPVITTSADGGDDATSSGGDGAAGDGAALDGADGAGGPCTNGKKDGDETAVDCGGSCGPCEPNVVCKVDADCATKKCGGGFCQLVSLSTWVKGFSLFNPVKVDGGSAGVGRIHACAVRAGSFIHYIAGTSYDDGVTFKLSGSSQYFNLDTNTSGFVDPSATTLPPRQFSACVTGPDSNLYLFGGENSTDMSVASWKRAASPADAPWNNAILSDLSQKRRNFAVALAPNNKIYAFGGEAKDVAAAPAVQPAATKTIEEFTTTNGWTAIGAQLGLARYGLAAATGVDGKIYVIGGATGSGPSVLVDAFDPMTKTVTAAAEMSTTRESFAAVAAPDGRIYAIGGRMAGTGLGGETVEAYSPTSNTWTAVANLPQGRLGHSAVVAPNGQIWVIGGAGDKNLPESTLRVDIYVYGPRLTVSAATVMQGGTIDVTGMSFAPSSKVQLYLDDKNTPIASGTADSAGALPTTAFKLPSTAGTGGHKVLAIDSLSRYPVMIKIDVN
jgi:N-acetylneuraminic acid mutarotase